MRFLLKCLFAGKAILVLFFFLSSFSWASQQETSQGRRSQARESLRMGDTHYGTIAASDPVYAGHGHAQQFEFVSPSNVKVTVVFESYEFDALLIVLSKDGKKLAEEDSGGMGTNAMLDLNAQAGVRYTIIAIANEGKTGTFLLSITDGRMANLLPRSRMGAILDFRREAAKHALAQEDPAAAARHRYLEGWYHFNQGNYTQALSAYNASLSLSKEAGFEQCEASSLQGLARIHSSWQEYKKAEKYAQSALPIFRKLKRPNDEAWVLSSLGLGFLETRRYPKAREHYQQALEIFRKISVPDGEAWALTNLGRVFSETGHLQKAQESLEASRSIFQKLRNRHGEAWAVENLGIVHSRLSNYSKSQSLHERSLKEFRRMGDRFGECKAVGNLGTVFWETGDYKRARECSEQKLSIARKLGLRRDQAEALLNIGLVCYASGAYGEAKKYYFQSHSLCEPSTELLGNIGFLYLELNECGKARKYFHDQLSLAMELGEPFAQQSALNGLGRLYKKFGNYKKALEYYEKALELSRERGNLREEAMNLYGIGRIFLELKNYQKAEEYARMSLKISQARGFFRTQTGGFTLLARINEDKGHLEKAIEYSEKSLSIIRKVGELQGKAAYLHNLGWRHLQLGKTAEAKKLAEESLAIHEKLEMPHRILYPLLTLAQIALMEEKTPAAKAALERADKFIKQPFHEAVEIEEASVLRAEFSKWGLFAQDLTAHLNAKGGSSPASRAKTISEGFAHEGFWKGRALLEGIVEHFQGGRTQEAIQVRRERRDNLAFREEILKRISEAIQEEQPAKEVAALREQASSILNRVDALTARLREVSPRDASLDAPPTVSPQSVQKSILDERTVLIDYAEGKTNLYAYVLTKKGIRFFDLGKKGEIHKSATKYVSGITDPKRLATLERIVALGQSLYDRLLKPALQGLPEEVDRLVILPSVWLSEIPFEALVKESRKDGGQVTGFSDVTFVIDAFEVSYAPSSPVLLELAEVGARTKEGRVLVLADPLYPSEQDGPSQEENPESLSILTGRRGTPSPEGFGRLAKTRREALAIGRMLLNLDREDETGAASFMALTEKRSGELSTKWFDLYLGKNASPAQLRRDLRDYAILHLAAHGYVDREFSQRTGLALSFGKKSGGFFSISDVLEMDLDTNLVVLSACDTARGRVRFGEGVQSLARAFLYAGSRSVIASLWQVSDWAAADTFEEFYKEVFQKGMAPAEALRKAKLALRRSNELRSIGFTKIKDETPPVAKTGHPFFWAPFIHIGLPRQ